MFFGDLHNAVLVLADDSAAGVAHVGPVAVVKQDDVEDNWGGSSPRQYTRRPLCVVRFCLFGFLLTELEEAGAGLGSLAHDAVVVGAEDLAELAALGVIPVAPEKC